MMTWNPFDWTASHFLLLYVALAIIVMAVGIRLKMSIGSVARDTRELSVLELACLAGGARRVGDAVLLGLTSGNHAIVDSKGRITVTDPTPLQALTGQPTLLSFKPAMTRKQFQNAIPSIVDRTQLRLKKLGYVPSDVQMRTFRLTFLPIIVLLLVFGMIRLMAGVDQHHPVGFLVGLLAFTGMFGLALLDRPRRTPAGDDAVRNYQALHARVARAPLDHELLVAVALSGTVVLSGTPYAQVYAASQTMFDDGGGGCGSGGGCGGGGGGGCGG
jgi:uncharacterized protein (TIGR04222 family)